MNEELEKAIRVVAIEKKNVVRKRFELANGFRTKMNTLISKTPSGDLRNELSELNILFEAMLQNDALLDKLKQ